MAKINQVSKEKPRSYHSKKQKKKGPTVVRLLTGGGCSAPDVVSHYISPPNSNIPAGYDGVQSIFQRVFYSPGPAQSTVQTVAPPSYAPLQAGGGYMINPGETIGKVPVVQPYAPKAEPLILNGQVLLSNGCESQCGAGKISSHKIKKMTQRKSKSEKRSKSQERKRRESKKVKESRRGGSKTSRRNRVVRKAKKQSRRQRGGNEGVPGNFSPDMMTRDFSGRQPEWNVNTI